jgi:hypothetical protein
MSERRARGAGMTEERAERGTSEHATRESRAFGRAKAEREAQ